MRVILFLIKYLLMFIGGSLILSGLIVAIANDETDKWYGIIPLLIFGIGFFFAGKVMEVQSKTQLINPIKIQTKALIQPIEPPKINMLNSKVNYGKLLQFLESTDIISNTASLDTLTGRIEFINLIYPDIINLSNESRYKQDVQAAVDEFKSTYYDKILSEHQIGLLINTDESNLKIYFSDCIYNCYRRYVERQKIEIQKLVRQSAIEKRKDDLIKIGYSAKYMFKTYELPDNGHLDAIEEIRKQFYSYQKK